MSGRLLKKIYISESEKNIILLLEGILDSMWYKLLNLQITKLSFKSSNNMPSVTKQLSVRELAPRFLIIY